MICLGIYSTLEDKWYSLLEKVDQYIPVLGIVDKIDNIFPSFLLFSIFLLLILALLSWTVFFANPVSQEAELIVLTKEGIPLAGAEVELTDFCATQLLGMTNEEGKAAFSVCGEFATVSVKKTGYLSYMEEVTFENSKAVVYLSPVVPPQRDLFLMVTDKENETILGARIELQCASDTNKIILSNQTEAGFNTKTIMNCSLLQAKATASGFEQKTVTITQSQQRVIIPLDKENDFGKVLFEAFSGEEVAVSTEINIKEELTGLSQVVFTNAFGTKQVELKQGDYSYTAINEEGKIETGSFLIIVGETVPVKIEFPEKDDTIIEDNKLYLFVETYSSAGNPLNASVSFFRDGNILSTRNTTTQGKIENPVYVANEYSQNTFYALIEKQGYVIQIVRVTPIKLSQTPTKVTLVQSTSLLNVITINDLNAPEKNADVIVHHKASGILLGNSKTDINGMAIFSALPSGEFILSAFDSARKEEAKETIQFTANTQKEVILRLITGRGSIRYSFYLGASNSSKVNASYSILEKVADSFESIYSGMARTGYAEAKNVRTGTIVKSTIADGNYFFHETINHEITRQSQDKKVFLKTQESLPNQNEVQMFYNETYSSSPVNTTMTAASQIIPNKSYYLYFDVLINSEEEGNVAINFFLDNWGSGEGSKILLQEALSIEGYSRLMSNEDNNFFIEPVQSPLLVDGDARKVTVHVPGQKGKKTIPVFLKISLDLNAQKGATLYYQARMGATKSLLYSKNIIIGEKICTEDCPQISFINQLVKGGQSVFVENDLIELFSDDDVSLRIAVQNLTDEQIENAYLAATISKEYLDRVTFLGDVNKLAKPITLLPLAITPALDFKLNISKKGIAKITETVEKYAGGLNILKDYEGNGAQLRLNISDREIIELQIVPESIMEGAEYPLFLIKAKYKGKGPAIVHWTAKEKETQYLLAGGTTDANGIQLTEFSTISQMVLKKGQRIVFEAYDDNGAIPVTKEIIVSGFVSRLPEPLVPECLTVKVGGVLTTTNYFSSLNLGKGQQGTIVIDSNCEEERIVAIKSDVPVSELSFTIQPKSTKAISVTATPRKDTKNEIDLLGAYPLQIFTLNGTALTQLGFIDVIISDSSSCFELQNAVFDLRTIDQLSSAIINKCFSGRKDNYNPKMTLSTNSVSMPYSKPGRPETVSGSVRVTGVALESYVAGLIKSNTVGAKNPCEAGSIIKYLDPPTESNIAEDVSESCEDYAWDGTVPERAEPWIPEGEIIPMSVWKSSSSLPSETTTSSSGIDINLQAAPNEMGRLFFEDTEGTDLGGAITSRTEVSPGDFGSMSGAVEPETEKEPGTPPSAYAEDNKEIEWYWTEMVDPYGNATLGAAMPDGTPFDKTSFVYYNYLAEKNQSYYIVTVGQGRQHYIELLGRAGEAQYLRTRTLGRRNHSPWSSCTDNGYVYLETDAAKILNRLIDRHASDDVVFEIKNPVEGKIYELGYYAPNPVPEWTEVEEIFDHESGDTWLSEAGTTNYTLACAYPQGFVSREYGKKVTASNSETSPKVKTMKVSYDSYDPLNGVAMPLFEYDSSGIIYYTIWPWDVMEPSADVGMEYFMKDGTLYGKYRGNVKYITNPADRDKLLLDYQEPSVPGPNIDFSIIKNKLEGTEYAVITVTDWINGTEKQQRAFQVRLEGQPNPCYSETGVVGVTGTQFAPRVRFNWDWSNIAEDQCDSKNGNYIYCDGTQFLVSLFKRIQSMDNLMKRGSSSDLSSVVNKSTFDAYLIKDNYSQILLNDFEDFFSSSFANADASFNTTPTSKGLDQFITQGKLSFNVDRVNGQTILPFGGLYRVELDIDKIDPSILGLTVDGEPNATIKVSLVPLEEAPNNNPFYELAFDGAIGQNTAQKDYGVGIIDGNIKLNTTTSFSGNPSGITTLNYSTTTNPAILSDRIVLRYNYANHKFDFNPAQPTPVIMTVTSDGGNISSAYVAQGTGEATLPAMKWSMISSTVGNSKSCLDLEENQNRTFFETKSNATTHTLSWTKAVKGTISLSTVFFTSKGMETTLRITPVNDKITLLKSYPEIKNSTAIMLNSYVAKGNTDFDSIDSLFNKVKQEQMCITQNPQEKFEAWWNPEYLDQLQKEANSGKAGSCK